MAKITFARHLQRFFPNLRTVETQANTVAQVVAAIDEQFPGLAAYLVDDAGALRKHVNVFVGDQLVRDRQTLSDAVKDNDEIFILQALSGG
jgi:molybdopterin converting factor small subunit